jgi:ribosome-interacting GTPase 1
MARTQKNKATAFHLGILKAKLAKYRRELLTPKGGGGGGPGEGNYDKKNPIFQVSMSLNLVMLVLVLLDFHLLENQHF